MLRLRVPSLVHFMGGTMSDLFGFTTMIMASALFTAVCGLASAFALKEPSCETKVVTRENLSIPLASREMLHHRRIRNFLVAGILAQFGVYGLVSIFAPYVQGMVGTTYAASWVGVFQAVSWGLPSWLHRCVAVSMTDQESKKM